MAENDRIKVTCPNCLEEFYVVRNTRRCPNCEINLREDVVELFAKLDTNLANNKIFQGSKKTKKVGESMKEKGSCLENFGCTLMLLPITFICLLFLLSMCGASL